MFTMPCEVIGGVLQDAVNTAPYSSSMAGTALCIDEECIIPIDKQAGREWTVSEANERRLWRQRPHARQAKRLYPILG